METRRTGRYNEYYFEKLKGQALEICFLDDPRGEYMIGILDDYLVDEDEHRKDIVVMYTEGRLIQFPVSDIAWVRLLKV
jgi:hypothetical protein